MLRNWRRLFFREKPPSVTGRLMEYAVFFLLLTLVRRLFHPEIRWVENLVLAAAIFAVNAFVGWAWKPIDYTNGKKPK